MKGFSPSYLCISFSNNSLWRQNYVQTKGVAEYLAGKPPSCLKPSLIMYPQKRLSLWVPGPLCMPHFLRRQLASFLGWASGVLRLTFQLKQMRVGKGQWCPTATGGMKFGTFGGQQKVYEKKDYRNPKIRRSQWHLWYMLIYDYEHVDRWFW